MMEKMKFESKSINEERINVIQQLLPGCVKEIMREDGIVERRVDFNSLKLMLGVDEEYIDEKYDFTWPGKKNAILEANTPIRMTLRPKIERSYKWENTENIFIEGDNLTALKLLQESYLGKVKMIYIDPPYNTGSDLIYNDSFFSTADEYDNEIGIYDDQGNKLFKNTEANGRFHSDWCSMIYSRLMLARNLLSDDGVIYISMDDNEQANLMKICDEIFGESNYIGQVIRKTKSMTADNGNGFNMQHEILFIYGKNASNVKLFGEGKEFNNYSNPDNDPNGDWCTGDPSARSGGPTTLFEIENPYTHRKDMPPLGRYWAFSKTTLDRYIEEGKIKFKTEYKESERGFVFKRYKKDAMSLNDPVHSLFAIENQYMNQSATIELKEILGDSVFSYPKPVAFIKKLVKYSTDKDDIVLDFFAGSGTTAQAVMEVNAEDGGKRKYIMVQLPEQVDNENYDNICEISEKRIKLSGERLEQNIGGIDVGFRVFSVDDSNMKDVYFGASEYNQNMLSILESNIKEDRTDLDLLFGCMIDWGLPLSLTHTSEEIEGYIVHTYSDGDLVACFNPNIPDSVIKTIAKRQPLRAVFRDSSFEGSPAKINVSEIFKLLAPDTRVKVI